MKRAIYTLNAQKNYYERTKADPIKYAHRLLKEKEARQKRNQKKKEENIKVEVTMYSCICGSCINSKNIKKHEKTKKHINIVSN